MVYYGKVFHFDIYWDMFIYRLLVYMGIGILFTLYALQ